MAARLDMKRLLLVRLRMNSQLKGHFTASASACAIRGDA